MMKRRTLLSALAAASAAAALPSRAQSTTKIVFGYTAVTDFASVFVAAEEGSLSWTYECRRPCDEVVDHGRTNSARHRLIVGSVSSGSRSSIRVVSPA